MKKKKIIKMPGFPMYACSDEFSNTNEINPSLQNHTSYKQSHKKHPQKIENESLQNP